MHDLSAKTVFDRSHRCIGILLAGHLLCACSGEPPPAAEDSRCDGRLQTRIFGGIEADLDWRGSRLDCAGMPRPDDEGARLRFSGVFADGEQQRHLLFILALPTLQPGGTGEELPTTITIIEEDAGRFFSNRDNPVCWTNVESQDPLGPPDAYRIRGVSYCVAPLAELSGSASVSFADLNFTGNLSWVRPQ